MPGGGRTRATAVRHAPPGARSRRAERRAEARQELKAARRAAAARAAARVARPRRPAPSSTLVLGLAVASVVAILTGVALASGFLSPPGGGGPEPAGTAHTVARVAAAAATVDGPRGWLAAGPPGTVRRFDPSSGALQGHPVAIGGTPQAIAAGYGKVWVTDVAGNQIVPVDERTGRAQPPIAVGQDPVSVATGEGGVWVASLQAGTVSLIDPAGTRVVAAAALPDGAVRVAVGAGAVWVTGQDDSLTRIDPRPNGVTLRWRTVTVGRGPIGVAVGGGAVWVADAQSGTISRIDPTTLRVTGTFPDPVPADQAGRPDPVSVAVAAGRVWVADYVTPVLAALDARTGRPAGRPVKLPGAVAQLDVQGSTLWVTTANPGTVVRVDPR